MPSKIIKLGDEGLKRLNLPPASALLSIDSQVACNYAILGQCLDTIIRGKEPNEFHKNKLPYAIKGVQSLSDTPPPPSLTDIASAEAWIAWLKASPQLQKIELKRANEKKGMDAPVILRFLAELAKLQDMDAIINAKDALSVSLAELRSGPIKTPLDCKEAVLAFMIPKNKNKPNSYSRVLLTVTLTPDAGDAFNGYLGPNESSQLMVSKSEFFNLDNEPLGDFSEESIAEVIGRPWPSEALAGWKGFLKELDVRCTEMFGGPLHEFAQKVFGNYEPNLSAQIVDKEKIQATQWRAIYEEILMGDLKSIAVNTIVQGVVNPVNIRLATAPRNEFMGNMDICQDNGNDREVSFPLDPSQRLAAMHAATLEQKEGQCILPINGPPGTGKTSFLRAVLASRWVKAALDQLPSPPITYGTGATNKAIVNIIEAFSKVPGCDSGDITGRWLDGLPSYGWLYPSKQAAEDYPEFMQLSWDDKTKNPFSPQAAASEFSEIPINRHVEAYLNRACNFLKIQRTANLKVATIVAELHRHIAERVNLMQSEQAKFEKCLENLVENWRGGCRLAGAIRSGKVQIDKLTTEIRKIEIERDLLFKVIEIGNIYLKEVEDLLVGWRSWLPQWARRFFFKKRLADFVVLENEARNAFANAGVPGVHWSDTIPLLKNNLAYLVRQNNLVLCEHARLSEKLANAQETYNRHLELRARRRKSWQEIDAMTWKPNRLLPKELPIHRYVRNFCGTNEARRIHARDMLWARFDSLQDLEHRVYLFHLAARYWEGRWLQMQIENIPIKNDVDRIRQLMMLGVIVVATTHKLCDLGRKCPADLLIMDEAGQCTSEVAVAVLAFAKSAVFVGDTKQLQPVSVFNMARVEHFARSIGIDPVDVPSEFYPCKGSGMHVAQRASIVNDCEEAPGITLLYHYRCHPTVIGYSNAMMYSNRMSIVRLPEDSPAGLPPMSWVAVESVPAREGSSWINRGELEEIVRWIKAVHIRLTKSYGKPLDQVLAVITPLAAQARLAKNFLKDRLGPLIGEDVIDRMTIGTIHRLQGAERPVVAFSLVQQDGSNTSLFADRDGGYLMNVAVSRAKDCFIAFASRKTLRPAPTDEARKRYIGNSPVAKLGAYLRQHGTRLYPRVLVVVEAINKVCSIKRALGFNVDVIATGGSFRKSSMAANGYLEWSPVPPTFSEALNNHKGLLDEVIIATDDDMTGELIGMHVAEVSADIFGEGLKVRRMRFHSVTPDELQLSFREAGAKFDANLLAAALLREYAHHVDQRRFKRILPYEPYVSAAKRDIVALSSDLGKEHQWEVRALLSNGQGKTYEAFVPEGDSTLAGPRRFEREEDARASAASLVGCKLEKIFESRAVQVPGLYPSSTTMRILAIAADELNIKPAEAQDHLNAMYQEGGHE